jgi:hypothetical protein
MLFSGAHNFMDNDYIEMDNDYIEMGESPFNPDRKIIIDNVKLSKKQLMKLSGKKRKRK